MSACVSQGDTGCCSMKFATSFENVTRRIWTTVHVSSPTTLRPNRVRTRYIEAPVNSSKMRLRVLRRDRYRCRSCSQTGDEITLEVRQIQPSASTIEEMLTLCVHCRNLVNQWNIIANSSLAFLEHLRHRLSAIPGTQSQATSETLNGAGCSRPLDSNLPNLRFGQNEKAINDA